MRCGDGAFFYHSGEGKAIVGIVAVIREFYPDPTDDSGKFGMVDVKAVRALPRAVTLDRVKAEPTLKSMALVTHSRLSVQPVTDEEWRAVWWAVSRTGDGGRDARRFRTSSRGLQRRSVPSKP
jgi:predicted RNA-binding protein with PUA-like domain